MNRVTFLLAPVLILILATPLFAIDFTVDDFDPAPDDEALALEIAQNTRLAVAGLMSELYAVQYDSDGYEIFSVMPIPMELVALMTQADIFYSLARTAEEMAVFVDEANSNKPGPNYFGFIIDGEEAWVNRNASVWYIPDVGGTQGIMIPAYVLNISPEDSWGTAFSEWILIAETPAELDSFLAAASVMLLIEDEDGLVDPISLDISYWRSYGLFDLRTGEYLEEETEEPIDEPEPTD